MTMHLRTCALALLLLCGCSAAFSGRSAMQPDLAALLEAGGLDIHNRTVTRIRDGARTGVRMSEGPGNGVAYLDNLQLGDGTIEFDIRGKDVPQQSFVGIAFHGIDSTTYDAIYFRPFNFRATDDARRVRAVQYISHPTYTWSKLRTEHPGKYEQPVQPVPDPDGWFHVRVELAGRSVRVFVDDAAQPSLVVERLSNRTHGRVGLWVGESAGADFANLRIRPAGAVAR